uniref:Uncharacterized protein n=1 Tax=Brassica campestris TaxID=3711 RepID=A0A3P5YSN0_BRACM|nr:unnamed protein product [Brassica rapa]
MGNSLRCCIACVLPCGALDLIRIVHLNGHVQEITRSITAGDPPSKPKPCPKQTMFSRSCPQDLDLVP